MAASTSGKAISSDGPGAGDFRQVKIRVVKPEETRKERFMRWFGFVPHGQFCTNEISTSKYTVITFLPKNLFEQFSRVANCYFLIIMCLQLIPGLSSIPWYSTAFPLAVVLGVNMAKEIYDDFHRHRSDSEINNRKVTVIRTDGEVPMAWKDIMVGDVLKVECDADIPADMVVLASSDPERLCYVETANLDGETNLKLKYAYSGQAKVTMEGAQPSIQSDLTINCEHPNPRLYQFEGNVVLPTGSGDPLDASHLLLRGSTLRQTDWIIAVVVFSGPDTKIMKNQLKGSRKVTQLEHHMNWLVTSIFAAQIIACLLLGMAFEIKWDDIYNGSWYLNNGGNTWPEYAPGAASFFIQCVRFILLLYQLIPISMYVTLELVKVLQSKLLLEQDRAMYHPDTDTATRARTTTLNEDLGQVQYVLTDKTGTLTQNVMGFVCASVNGVMYGMDATPPDDDPLLPLDTAHSLVLDPSMRAAALQEGTKNSEYVVAFLMNLAVCNTVVPTVKEDGSLLYQAASPDEEAFVQGAAFLGAKLVSRNVDVVEVELGGELLVFQVLAVIEFNSDRKRMSVICRTPDGTVRLYCKGADNVMYARIAESTSPLAKATQDHLDDMSRHGYRTLVITEKDLDEAAWEDWHHRWKVASASLENREGQLAELGEELEVGMRLLGATGVEDKLQDEVPEALASLRRMGINVWVLTGDKMETAISIANTSGLFTTDMHVMTLHESDLAPPSDAPILEPGKHQLGYVMSVVERCIKEALTKVDTGVGLVVEGHALSVLLMGPYQDALMDLCRLCKVVVCCRVSPMQKALVTKMVRKKAGAITLAIGDGANDVPMIQSAHIGVGISGREGRAAVLASDFSFGQFRFLIRLLLVHGRWSWQRNSTVVNYIFYKNFVYCMPIIYFAFVSAYSATSIYQAAFISTYNAVWTAAPIVAFAVLEQDLFASTILRFPEIYADSRLATAKIFFKDFGKWMISASWHSVWVFVVPLYSMGNTPNSIATYDDIRNIGVAIATAVIITVNLKMGMRTHHWTWINHLCLWAGTLLWFLFVYVMSVGFPDLSTTLSDWDMVAQVMFAESRYWLVILVCAPAVCLIPDLMAITARRYINPTEVHILQEWEGLRSKAGYKEQPKVTTVEVEMATMSHMDRRMSGVPPSIDPNMASDSHHPMRRRSAPLSDDIYPDVIASPTGRSRSKGLFTTPSFRVTNRTMNKMHTKRQISDTRGWRIKIPGLPSINLPGLPVSFRPNA